MTLQAMEIYFVLYIIYSHGTVTKVTKRDIGLIVNKEFIITVDNFDASRVA